MMQSLNLKEYATSDKKYLPANYEPADCDVICGRGKNCYNHNGNRRYRETVDMALPNYIKVETKTEKSIIVINIVDQVRSWCADEDGSGFVRFDRSKKLWYEIGDAAAREKVGQTIRETLTTKDPVKQAQRRKRHAACRAKRATKQQMGPIVARRQPQKQQRQGSISLESFLSTSDAPAPANTSLESMMDLEPIALDSLYHPCWTLTSIPTTLNALKPKTKKGNGNKTERDAIKFQVMTSVLSPTLDDTPLKLQPCSSVNTNSNTNNDSNAEVTGTDADAVLAAIPPELTMHSSGNWFSDKEKANLMEVMSSPAAMAAANLRRASAIDLPFNMNGWSASNYSNNTAVNAERNVRPMTSMAV